MSVSSQAIAPVEDSLSSARIDQAPRSSGFKTPLSMLQRLDHDICKFPFNPPLILPRSIRTLFCSTSSIHLISHRRSLFQGRTAIRPEKHFIFLTDTHRKVYHPSPCSTPLSLSALPPSLASPAQAPPPPQPPPSPARPAAALKASTATVAATIPSASQPAPEHSFFTLAQLPQVPTATRISNESAPKTMATVPQTVRSSADRVASLSSDVTKVV